MERHCASSASSSKPQNPYRFTREEYNSHVDRLAQPVVSTISEYEEIELVPGCTLYDLYRQPRIPVTDKSVVRALPVRTLNVELTCPVCLCIVREAEVVMECLHRFCSKCIQMSLRGTSKDCPSCRKHIPSKRSLRKDPNFDQLIAKIYPDLDAFEKEEEELIAEINRSRHFNNALTESTKIGVQHQESKRRQVRFKWMIVLRDLWTQSDVYNGKQNKKRALDELEVTPTSSSSDSSSASEPNTPVNGNRDTTTTGTVPPALSGANGQPSGPKNARVAPADIHSSNSSSTTTSATATTETTLNEKVNVRIVLHPEEVAPDAPRLTRTLFTTGRKLKIRHLKRHLCELLNSTNVAGMRIVLPKLNVTLSGLQAACDSSNGQRTVRRDLTFDQELEDYLTLSDVYQQYGMGLGWELHLQYHFSDTILNGVAQFISNGN
jgi:Zinc finger, C3HC4 type (RING finger)